MIKHYTKKPKDNHARCETFGCKNYYNVTYRGTNNKCSPCRRKERRETK